MEKDNDKSEVRIDYKSLFEQFADKIIADFVCTVVPVDEKTKRLLAGILTIHRKYGIDAATSIKIMTELGELMKEE